MMQQQFWRRLEQFAASEALIYREKAVSYSDLCAAVDGVRLEEYALAPKSVVALRADYSPQSIALFLALLRAGCVVALLPDAPDYSYHLEGLGCSGVFDFTSGELKYQSHSRNGDVPALIGSIFSREGAGFIIYSSGSSGKPKIILHDLDRFLSKFSGDETAARILSFFLFDHVAGLDRLFLTLVSGSTFVIPEKRDPSTICRLVEAVRVEVLPVSPSFVNLLLLSGEHAARDLSSLKLITYGSEPISEAALEKLQELFPAAEIRQTYGASEVGSLRVLSKARDSLWIRPCADYFQPTVRDGILWVKSTTTMLGYLHTTTDAIGADGWYCTGDMVEQDGEWLRILGRDSDLIIVGGEKVFPKEVEEVIEAFGGALAAVVKGEPNPILGAVVVAMIQVDNAVDPKLFQKELRKHCRAHLAPYKVPMKMSLTNEPIVTERNKKNRQF